MGHSKSMTTNIYKVLICCFLLIGNFVKGQELISGFPTLSPGEYIYDAQYIEEEDLYILVGEFTLTSGPLTYKNIVFLNSDFTINTSFKSFECNAPVTSIAIFKESLAPGVYGYIVYFGGLFTNVTYNTIAYSRNGIARFDFNFNETGFISAYDYIDAWDADLDWPGVYDMEVYLNRLVFVGDFYLINSSSTPIIQTKIASYWGVSGSHYSTIDEYSDYSSSTCYDIESMDGAYYTATVDDEVTKETPGVLLWEVPPSGSSTGSYFVRDLNDSLIVVNYDAPGDGSGEPSRYAILRKTDGTIKTDYPFSTISGTYGALTQSIATYQGYLYISRSTGTYNLMKFSPYELYSPTGAIPIWTTSLSGSFGNVSHADNYPAFGSLNKKNNLIVVNNILFASFNNMVTASGQTRVGLAAYCLEPQNAQPFTDFDLDVCPLDTFTYTIPPSDFADGYLWEFSGTGVSLGATGAPELLSYDATSVTGNSIQIAFGIGFSPGNLTVTPYSNCGGNLVDPSNVQYAQPQTIYIDTNPLPDVYAGLDTTLTCRRTSVLLEGFSSTPGVTYEWIQLGPYNTVGTDTIATTDGEYVFQVTDALGCPNFDTVIVSMDTIKPDVILPLGPFSITCADTVRNLLGSTSITDSLLFWRKVSSMDSLSNPVSANGLGEYRLIVEDTINGCRDSAAVFMFLDQTPPNILVSGYPDLAAGGYLDTINCYFPNLLLNAHSDSINAVINWCNEDSTNFVGTDTLIENGGWFYLFAEDTVKGCTNYGKVLIFEDFGQPDVSINSTTALNCSNDSLILNATTLVGDTLIWTGSLIPSSSNPLTVFDPGWYFITAIDSLNGCSRLDSIEIIADNSIDVMAGNDTIACNQELIPFSASYIGSISGITYAWNNGSTDALSFYTAGLDSVIVVEINGDGGCYGTDTVRMDIPPIPVIEFTGYQPCGDGPTGQIVGDPLSGFAPFTYSIDGGITYQTTPVFTGLGFGTYPIWVKDSLSCDYEFEAIIDQSSALPEPEFLFSTYNFATDTVVIIDVSNPPTDSTTWDFPTELMVLDSNALSPMLLLPDTGSFEIIMHAWYGTCEVITSKLIYASPFDSSSASFYNQNGIKSIELYPNPTTGEFTVNIEFYKSQRAAISLQDMLGYSYAFYSYDETAFISELITMDAAALNGTYVLKVVSEFDSAAITFILSR